MFPMAEPNTCPTCRARNPADAQWCGQCFEPLGQREEPVGTVDSPESAAVSEPAEPPPGASDGSAGPSWTCSICDTVNPVASSECRACGSAIFESFGGSEEKHLEVDPRSTLLRSLVFPGLGHFPVGQSPLGVAIGGLVLVSLGFGVILMVSGLGPYGLFLVLVAVGLWLVAALDAYRWANGEPDEVLLRPKVLTILVGVVVAVVILAVMVTQGRAGA